MSTLYWEAQEIHDKLFEIERHMKRLSKNGKAYATARKYYNSLLGKLRRIESRIHSYEIKYAV